MDIEVKMKQYEDILGLKCNPEGFNEYWEKAFMSGNFVYMRELKPIVLNLLILNKGVGGLRKKKEAENIIEVNNEHRKIWDLQHNSYQSARAIIELQEEVIRLKAELQEIKYAKICNSDPFLSILHLWITSHPDQEICTKDLFINLKAISQDKGLLFTLPDARALGVKIKQYEEELKQKYSLTSRTGAGNVRYYSFKEAGLE